MVRSPRTKGTWYVEALAQSQPATSPPARLDTPRIRTRYERLAKPILDRTVGALLLLCTAPLMLMVGGLVALTMGRPVLFRQERLGYGAEPFTMLKFRSMAPDRRHNQGEYDGPERRRTHKTDADPRHTKVGRMLRRTSLDELPQLVNVVKGEMSLVGPRPELPSVAEEHDLVDHIRHAVAPGITGPWQISEERTDFIHEHVHLDELYARRVTLRGDVVILANTVREVSGRILHPHR